MFGDFITQEIEYNWVVSKGDVMDIGVLRTNHGNRTMG
jgi:hypothetical protein